MHLLDSYSQTFLFTNQERSDKQRENFKISAFSLVNNKLNMGIQNIGDIPINITRLWVQNTTTTDWFRTYSLNANVAPGSTVSNVGQSIPLFIDPTKSYTIKLVTSRGNAQQLALNSASSAPLNIQLLALPASVPSGLTTELVMIVTNNGSSTLTNISPKQPFDSVTGSATCTYGPPNPPSYNILPPGSTAVFKWDVVVTGAIVSGQPVPSCTITASLQNGYLGNTAQATFSLTTLRVTSTDWSTNTGIMTLKYTSFQWSQGNGWHSSWQLANGHTAFALNVSNNNATSGSNFYISKQTMLIFHQVGSNGDVKFFITQGVDVSGSSPSITQPYTCSGPPANDFCLSIPPQGWRIIYFAADSVNGNKVQNLVGGSGNYLTYLAMYGKYATAPNAPGNEYAQNLPYIAVIIP